MPYNPIRLSPIQPRRLSTLAAVVAAALVAACSEQSLSPEQPGPQAIAGADAAAGRATAARPESSKEAEAAIAEARSLRSAGDKTAAVQRIERASAEHPRELALIKERGLLALELGQVGKAEALLRKAIDPRAPDWRVHLGLGTALATSGKQQQAQLQFARALELAPEHPAILNNLALSYALDGKPREAELLLRRIGGSDTRSRQAGQAKQNLALLLGLSGRINEAQVLSVATLPADQADANIEYFKAAGAETALTTAQPQPAAIAAAGNLPSPAYQLGVRP